MEKTNHMEYMEGMEVIASDIMEQVITSMEEYDYMAYSEEDVISALKRDRLSPKDFGALLSPAAAPFLEEMAKRAKLETARHFGNSVYLFTPIYISNYFNFLYCHKV